MGKTALVSVILPTYNEVENIVPLIKEIDAAIAQPHEIIVVDDNSPDGTWKAVEDLIHERGDSVVVIERRMSDRGLTKSLWRGIELSRGDTVVWMDCDFSMPPSLISKLLMKIEEGYDVAVGSRFVKGGKQKSLSKTSDDSIIAILCSTVLSWILRIFLHPGFRDWTSGFIAIRRDIFKKIKLRGDYGEYFIDLIFRCLLLKYRIIEIPYTCEDRRAGKSKTAPDFITLIRRIFQYLFTVVRLQGVRLRHWFS